MNTNGNTVSFSNSYGTVSVTPVTEFMAVSGIRKTHAQAKANTFSLDDAEKIALITENRKIQICPHFMPMDGLAYLILHDSPSTAAICKVEIKNFSCNKSAADEISMLNRMAPALV